MCSCIDAALCMLCPQSDAAIDVGSAGGPLLDSGGRMIGLSTALSTRAPAVSHWQARRPGVHFATASVAAFSGTPEESRRTHVQGAVHWAHTDADALVLLLQARSNGINFALSADMLRRVVPNLIVYGNAYGRS